MNKLLRETCTRAGTLAAALVLLTAATNAAWAQNLTITGDITDAQNAAVPAATVVLRGPGGERQAKTTELGHYEFKQLAAGSYSITVNYRGFAKFETTNINLGSNLVFDISLVVAMESQKVDVQDTDQTKVSVDPSQNGSALVLKGADLDMLSDDPDQLADDLSALAGPSAGPNGGQIFIDGFSGGQLPPKSSIREIRVNQNPYSPEYDRLGFGRIEILTKPGTDKLRGQILFSDSDNVFNSRNPLLGTKLPFQSKLVNGSLGGPLSKKASFNLDFEERWIGENAIIRATILDPSLQPQSLNQGFSTPQTRWHITPRVDYALSANNTLVGRFSYTDNTLQNQGVGTFNLPERAYLSGITDATTQLTETSIIGTHAVNETRFQYDHNHDHQDATGTLPTINVLSAFTSGSPSIGLSYTSLNELELSNMTTYTHGSHVFKWGGRARHYSVNDAAPTNFNGTFTFAGAYAPVLDPNNPTALPAVVCSTPGTAGCANISSIEQYRRTIFYEQLGYTPAQVRLFGGGASQFSLANGQPLSSVNQFDIGIFANDDWRLKPNFTLSYGIRYEAQTNSGDLRDFSPRLSFAWGLGGSAKKPAKSVLRAGFGVFYDRLADTMTLAAIRYNGITQQQYAVRDPSALDNPALFGLFTTPGVAPSIPTSSALSGFVQSASRTQISNSIVSPYIAQMNVGIDRQLPKNITVAVNYIYSRTDHSLLTRNINAPILALNGAQPYGAAAGNIFLYESAGQARQNQLVVNVNARINRRVQLFGFYVAQNAHSNTDGLATSPAYAYNESTEWGRSSFAPAQRLFLGGSVTIWKKISLAPHVTAHTGVPFNIVSGVDANGDTLFTERPSLATNLSAPGVVATRYGNFNLNPGPNDALIPRNYATGPASFFVNLRVARTWGFGERATASGPSQGDSGGGPPRGGGGRGGGGGGGGPMMMGGGGGPRGMGGGDATGKRFNVTLSASGRNILNHVNYGTPVADLSSPQFGTYNTISSGGFGPGGGGASSNRRLDLALRFTF
jgi:hypothetical protein